MVNKIKVCFIYRAANIHILRRAEGLINLGVEVHYIGFLPRHSEIDTTTFSSISFLIIPNIIKNRITILDFILNWRMVNRYIRDNKINLIHVQSPVYYLAIITCRVPYIIENMGSDVIKIGRNIARRLLFRIAFQNASAIIQDSKVAQDAARKISAPIENNHILDVGIKPELQLPKSKKNDCRNELKIDKDALVIFSIRTMIENSNIEDIIATMPQVISMRPSTMYLFATKPQYHTLNKLLSEMAARYPGNMRICGYLDNEREIPAYICASDIIISIPTSDSSPLSIFEAMAGKTPTIIRKHDWYQGKFREFDHFVPYDPIKDNLADQILNYEAYKDIAECAQALVLDKYTNRAISQNLLKIYNDIAKRQN